MRFALIGIPVLLAMVYGLLRLAASNAVYYPIRYPEGWWNLQQDAGASEVWLTARDGVKLNAWWIAAPQGDIVTVFFHGNGGNLTHRIEHMRAIVAAGSSLLIPDYRGYGKSEGKPSESGLYADADAAYQWLLDRGYTAKQIVIHGESLGVRLRSIWLPGNLARASYSKRPSTRRRRLREVSCLLWDRWSCAISIRSGRSETYMRRCCSCMEIATR
jgi:predicted alpha/beta hydrolase